MDTATWIALLQQLIRSTESEWDREQKKLHERYVDATTQAIASHHTSVVSWSNEAHSYLSGIESQAPTIELSFNSIPRRFGSKGQILDELDLLTVDQHVAVLGDPGAGKTTTLRRLAGHVAHESEQATGDDFRFAVLVVCRDERFDQKSLHEAIGAKVGISHSLARDLDDADTRLVQLLETGALVIIDGLDEVPSKHRVKLEKEIGELARHMRTGKIVVSCRSADYVPIEGLQAAEIQPFTGEQIQAAATALLETEDVDEFFAALQHANQSTADLASRPLFLAQMVAIFNAQGTIPERPSDLSEALIRLIIQEWDEKRRVRRKSRYAQFTPPEKRRFLSDLALELIRADLIRFREEDLVATYRTLAQRYELPRGQAREVARELESHTGLIVQIGTEYEYAHLSLQEYLAADSMVRGGTSATEEWWKYPSVAAIAAGLSSDPANWVIELGNQLPTPPDRRAIRSFLFRIAQEGPRFVRSASLGNQLLTMVWRLRLEKEDLGDLGRQLGRWKSIRDSVFDAMDEYPSVRADGGRVRMAIYADRSSEPDSAISVDTAFLRQLFGAEQFHRAVTRSST